MYPTTRNRSVPDSIMKLVVQYPASRKIALNGCVSLSRKISPRPSSVRYMSKLLILRSENMIIYAFAGSMIEKRAVSISSYNVLMRFHRQFMNCEKRSADTALLPATTLIAYSVALTVSSETSNALGGICRGILIYTASPSTPLCSMVNCCTLQKPCSSVFSSNICGMISSSTLSVIVALVDI